MTAADMDPDPGGDNGSAIQRAIDAAPAGSVVTIPAGTWRVRPRKGPYRPFAVVGRPDIWCSFVLRSGVTLSGVGAKAELRFDEPADQHKTRCICYCPGPSVPVGEHVPAAVVSNLSLTGSMYVPGTEGPDTAIHASGGNLLVRGCTFRGWRGKAVHAYGSLAAMIEAVDINDCHFSRGYGQALGASYVHYLAMRACRVYKNLNWSFPSRTRGAEAILLHAVKNLLLTDVYVNDWGTALSLTSNADGVEYDNVALDGCGFGCNGFVCSPSVHPAMMQIMNCTWDFAGDPRENTAPLSVSVSDQLDIHGCHIEAGGRRCNIATLGPVTNVDLVINSRQGTMVYHQQGERAVTVAAVEVPGTELKDGIS